MATEHLLELGHRRIGFVAEEVFALATREKGRGRQEALAAAGIDPAPHVAYAGFSVEGGRRALQAIVEAADGDRPTAVICSNDLMAIGAMQEAAALGLARPDDLSVVGFDGIDAAAGRSRRSRPSSNRSTRSHERRSKRSRRSSTARGSSYRATSSVRGCAWGTSTPPPS